MPYTYLEQFTFAVANDDFNYNTNLIDVRSLNKIKEESI